MHNFTHRYVVWNDPARLARYAERMDFDGEIARGRLLVGSPATVREQLGRLLRQSGANYFVGAFFFGSLTLQQAVRSAELFAQEVKPLLENVAPDNRRPGERGAGPSGAATPGDEPDHPAAPPGEHVQRSHRE